MLDAISKEAPCKQTVHGRNLCGAHMKPRTHLVALCVTAICVGCEGDDDTQDSRPTATQIEIASFDVQGTSDPVVGPTPIRSAENGGAFHVLWEITANGTVDVEISVGEPDSIAGNETFEFFDSNCGAGTDCSLTVDLACTFTASKAIQCTNAKGTDLSGFMESGPKDARIHIVVNGNGRGAGTAHAVQFE